MPDPDVIVVGAGPAGTHLALRLARAGWSVTLLDRAQFPRAKPCGEFLAPECLPLLEELGLAAELPASGAQPIRHMKLVGHGHHATGGYVPIGRASLRFDHGYAVRRERLDENALRAVAREPGVRVLEGHRVGSLVRAPGGTVLGVRAHDPDGHSLELRARFTVGADGLKSRVARQLGVWRRVPWLDKFALSTRVPRGDLSEHAEVHFLPEGYFAVAPVDEHLATLNLVVAGAALPRGRARLRPFLTERFERSPELAGLLAGLDDREPILATGPLAARTTAQTFDGAALVGDACGYVDPVTGEGLFFAMRGAALLARDLDAALHAGRTDAAALSRYATTRRREFAHRRALALLLQRGLRHPRVASAVLSLLEARPSVLELVMGLTGSSVPPRELLRPSVWKRALSRPAPGVEPAARFPRSE